MSGHEVRIPWSGDDVPGYAALPAAAERGAVVIHEILGRQPEIDRVVDRFARSGYAAVAPDLFAGGPACVLQLFRAASTGRGPAADKACAARDWLVAEAGIAESRVGLVGFCLGGGFALGIGAGWGAVSTNYGAVPAAERMRGIGPVIGCYGARDRVFGDNGEKLRAELQELGVPFEIHEFEDAGHSFLTDGEHPWLQWLTGPLMRPGYRPDAAERAWSRIFDFLGRHL